MSDTDSKEMITLLRQLVSLLEGDKEEKLPEDRLWTPDDVAAYLQVDRRRLMEHYAPDPGFPKPVKLPSAGGRGTKRWEPSVIKAWALGQSGTHQKRGRGRPTIN